MRRTNLILVLCLTLYLCAIAPAEQNETPVSSVNTSVASGDQKSALVQKLVTYRDNYRAAQWRYSWAYHFCVYFAAILSALAAWLSKVHVKRLGMDDPARRDNWTASMAAGATLLIAISTAGGLADRWQDNKKQRYAIESVLNQFEAEQNPTSEELEAYGKRLALIIDPNTELVIPPR
jgi:hypothetical protein